MYKKTIVKKNWNKIHTFNDLAAKGFEEKPSKVPD